MENPLVVSKIQADPTYRRADCERLSSRRTARTELFDRILPTVTSVT